MTDNRIVLCRPQSGENVGFVVRICANFGIEDLVLVEPVEDWLDGARRTACMCADLLERTRIESELATAVADRSEVFGFTARTGRDREVQDLSAFKLRAKTATSKPAWVFGNEESGLDHQEASLCTQLYRISVPGMASMNLSHAVAIAVFAGFAGSRERNPAAPAAETPHPLLDIAGKERLLERIKNVVGRSGLPVDDFQFSPSVKRLLLAREIQTRDARTLHRLLTHASHLMDKFAPEAERLDDFRSEPRT